MGFNKAKALEEAHKFVTQGKIARAIRQYQWIAENDPADLTLLNVIGDLYARDNNIPEALKYFYRLADAYSREGYKVKAIAIYKKISKIDRNTAEPMVRLAQLNAGLGLAREAREQYKNAFEFFERTGEKDKALEILRELRQLDPNSPSLRLKLAGLAERAGETPQAVEAYLEAAALARQSGDDTTYETALNKAAELAPGNPQVGLYRARQALANQRPEEVKDILDSVPDLQSDPQAQHLLLQSQLAVGKLDGARRMLLDVFHANPSDFSPVAEFVAHCIDRMQYKTALEVLTATAPEMIARRETGSLMETLRALCKAAPERIEVLEFMYQVAEKSADEATIPEVLEALGDAYVQSDQLENAEQSYARLVAREPENESYKELLKQVLQEQGKEYVPLEQTPLIEAGVGLDVEPESAGESVTAAEDSARAAIVNMEASKPSQTEVGGESGSLLPLQQEPPGQSTAGGVEQPLPSVEINLSQPAHEQGTAEEEAQLPPPQEIPLEFQASHGTEPVANVSSSEEGPHPGGQALPLPAQPTPAPDGTSVFNYEEHREEIEFYIRYGFHNEALKAVTELERKFPKESRVADLRRRVEESGQESSAPEAIRADAGIAAKESPGDEWELPTSFSEPSATEGWQNTLEPQTGERASAQELHDAVSTSATSIASQEQDAAVLSAGDASAELGSLLDELNEDNGPIVQAPEDEQTHYNLGVAFREMGLLDEAIGEFQKVVRGGDPKTFGPNFLQGCTLLAACFMDKGMPAIAAKWYERALEIPGLDHEGRLALYYDLGVAFEEAGNGTAALEKFTEVYSQNIDYRDVAEKIRLLRQSTS